MSACPPARKDREPSRSRLTHVLVGALTLAALLTQPFPARSTTADITFTYRGDTYVMDAFSTLFANTTLGNARRTLFETYLTSTPEGKKRVTDAGTADPEKVWAKLHVEEQTTFLAVTAGAGMLTARDGTTMLSYITTLDEIHGGVAPGGADYANNEAFRIYVRLSQSGVDRLQDDEERFSNGCTQKQFGYGGTGSTHPDFCLLPKDFEFDVKTDNHPNIQFNLTPSTRCADVDLDYDTGFQHFTKDNSNVLADPALASAHVPKFIKQYCDPGFRR
jgi:hypothetical protein